MTFSLKISKMNWKMKNIQIGKGVKYPPSNKITHLENKKERGLTNEEVELC